VLTVALEAGGAGTVLASSLKTWLQARRTAVKLTVTTDTRSISMDVTTAAEVEPILAQLLNTVNNEVS